MKRLALLTILPLLLTSCETVTPAAWVYFKADEGYVYYSTDMYGINGEHIIYFLNEEDKDDPLKEDLAIRFSPRILGPDEREIEGETKRCLCIDLSDGYVDMQVAVIRKTYNFYSPSKNVYLNDKKLEPKYSTISKYNAIFNFEGIELVRGNPNGHINNAINKIEYK